MALDVWRETIFALGWQQHQGSGLICDVGTAMDLEVGDALWLVERIGKQRKADNEAMRKASRR